MQPASVQAPRSILVTGATGYLGSHLSRKLVKDGCLVQAVRRSQSSLHRLADIESRMRFVEASAIAAAEAVTLREPVETVLHMATCYARNSESEQEVWNSNVNFPMDVLRFAISNGARRFINIDTPLPPDFNLYSRSKKRFLADASAYCADNNIQFTNIIPETIFGPGDDESKFPTFVIRSCIRNVPEIKLTAGKQLRDFIYIDDAIDALCTILKSTEYEDKPYLEYQAGSGTAVSVRQFAEWAHAFSASRTLLQFGALPYRQGEPMFSQADTSTLNRLGWHCQFSTEAAVRLTVELEK